ncbi:MAG: trimethylamine methyltransferase family protein, partial [Pseudomonadota bacterium]
RYLDPIIVDTSPDAIALDAIKSVGSEGHFFGIQHTQDRYSTAFYQPFLSDWKNFEGWQAAGAVWTPERAHTMFKEIVGGFEAPPMDAAIRDELADFAQHRTDDGCVVFADLHYQLALGAAGRTDAQVAMTNRFAVDATRQGEMPARVADPGKAALSGLNAFAEGRYDAAFQDL